MKTIRRLYFYAVALISLEVVLWGGIGLLRSIVNQLAVGGATALAQALALILVGVPIFLVHWLWVQNAASRDDEEKTASLRAIFFYAVLIGTLVPVVQNLLSLINRLLLGATGLSIQRAIVGGFQSWPDNLIAVFVNLLVAAYFWNTLQGAWKSLPERENFAEVRRLYRYLWMLYGLLMTVFGAQQILRFIFYIPSNTLGMLGRETFVNGFALLLVGTPIWMLTWKICQDALADSAERESNLRLGVLYLLALGGVISVLAAGGTLAYLLLNRLLGDSMPWSDFIQRIGGPLSIGIPLGVVWGYFGRWLTRHIESVAEGQQRESLKRPYVYILSMIGLVTAFIGMTTLIGVIIDLAVGGIFLGQDVMRERESMAIATLLVGLPLWLLTWRPIDKQAAAEGDMGEHARRSVVRKVYLYLALFGSVIGGMVSAVTLVFRLLSALLTRNVESGFLSSTLNLAQLLALFGVVLVYHLLALRRDGASAASALAAKQADFRVLVLDPGHGKFGEAMQAALHKQSAQMPVTVLRADEPIPDGLAAQALILPGSLAVAANAPLGAWLRSFNGSRLIVQDEAEGVVWSQDAGQAAAFARQLSEGQAVHPQKRAGSAWTIVIYIFAALFAIQFVFMLLAFGLSLIFG
ncbi:MAG: hypothetical protein HY869_15390 [Chloroflexi bacterium]|nr:hypothetical protein [Chloroflexota bacterium]